MSSFLVCVCFIPTDDNGARAPKPVCEQDDTVLRNQGVHTDGEVTADRSNIIIKNKKEKTFLLIDVAITADKCRVKGSREETKIQEFINP